MFHFVDFHGSLQIQLHHLETIQYFELDRVTSRQAAIGRINAYIEVVKGQVPPFAFFGDGTPEGILFCKMQMLAAGW